MPEPTQYIITLRPLPSRVPPILRLRRALKALLRSYGLRCTSVSIEPPASDPEISRDGGEAADLR